MDAAVQPSLRTNFAWTLAGNVVHAAGQWALLSLIAKLGTAEMLGEYALAFAVALPVAMLAHMNLRAVLATDISSEQPFSGYLRVRLAATVVGVAATAAVALVGGYRGRVFALMLLSALSLAADAVSDLYWALMQRRERMDLIARSMMTRGILGAIALGVALWATGSLLWAVAAYASARFAVLVVYDVAKGLAGERPDPRPADGMRSILKAALPLGAVLMLISLTTNLPRYAVEHHLGTRQLGVFAAVASFITVGNTVVNALGQSATPRLARLHAKGDRRAFRSLAFRLAALGVGLGVCGVAVAFLAGRLVLRLLYRPEYEQHSGVLVAVMASGIATYTAILLGYVLTSARRFGSQLPLLVAVAATCGIASWFLVPGLGLWGAAAALATAGLVQIAGEVFLLRRLIAPAERLP